VLKSAEKEKKLNKNVREKSGFSFVTKESKKLQT
jgi:hypothetical protein